MLRVVIPMVPASALNPNRAYRRGGWQPRRAAAAVLREMTWAVAMEVQPEAPMVGRVTVAAVIRWPKARRRLDYDASVAVLKPVLDGLTDAGWWRDDRQVVALHVEQETGHATGEVVITVDSMATVRSNAIGSGVSPGGVVEEAEMPVKSGGKKGGGKATGAKCPNCGMPKSKCKC